MESVINKEAHKRQYGVWNVNVWFYLIEISEIQEKTGTWTSPGNHSEVFLNLIKIRKIYTLVQK